MTDLTPNIPDIVAEVRELFERYEKALVEKNVEVMDNTYWNSPYTIRFGPAEHGWGFDQIHAHRVRRPPGEYSKEARRRLEILTLGRDIATTRIGAIRRTIQTAVDAIATAV